MIGDLSLAIFERPSAGRSAAVAIEDLHLFRAIEISTRCAGILCRGSDALKRAHARTHTHAHAQQLSIELGEPTKLLCTSPISRRNSYADAVSCLWRAGRGLLASLLSVLSEIAECELYQTEGRTKLSGAELLPLPLCVEGLSAPRLSLLYSHGDGHLAPCVEVSLASFGGAMMKRRDFSHRPHKAGAAGSPLFVLADELLESSLSLWRNFLTK